MSASPAAGLSALGATRPRHAMALGRAAPLRQEPSLPEPLPQEPAHEPAAAREPSRLAPEQPAPERLPLAPPPPWQAVRAPSGWVPSGWAPSGRPQPGRPASPEAGRRALRRPAAPGCRATAVRRGARPRPAWLAREEVSPPSRSRPRPAARSWAPPGPSPPDQAEPPPAVGRRLAERHPRPKGWPGRSRTRPRRFRSAARRPRTGRAYDGRRPPTPCHRRADALALARPGLPRDAVDRAAPRPALQPVAAAARPIAGPPPWRRRRPTPPTEANPHVTSKATSKTDSASARRQSGGPAAAPRRAAARTRPSGRPGARPPCETATRSSQTRPAWIARLLRTWPFRPAAPCRAAVPRPMSLGAAHPQAAILRAALYRAAGLPPAAGRANCFASPPVCPPSRRRAGCGRRKRPTDRSRSGADAARNAGSR